MNAIGMAASSTAASFSLSLPAAGPYVRDGVPDVLVGTSAGAVNAGVRHVTSTDPSDSKGARVHLAGSSP
jgi:hypothetical protein